MSSKTGQVVLTCGDMAKVELQKEKDSREKFDIWFRRSEGKLIVTMAEKMQKYHNDWDRWMEEQRNSPTMRLELKEEGGQLVFEEFAIECREDGQAVTGLIKRYRERGVRDVRTEARSPSGGKVTIWYEGEEKQVFSFWGIFASMPLSGWRGFDSYLPTVAIRPRIMPGKLIYWAPSVEDGVLFTDGWEMKMNIERQLYGLPDELSRESFFAPTHLTTAFPLVFPRELMEVEGIEVGEELAGELISKMEGLRALLDGTFPEEKTDK